MLGKLDNTVTGIDATNIAAFGYTVTVVRQGATVDDPNTLIDPTATGIFRIPVLDTGNIRSGDTVDVSGDLSGETYQVTGVGENGPNQDNDDNTKRLAFTYIEIDLGSDTVADTSIADGVRVVTVTGLVDLVANSRGGAAVANPYLIPDADNGVFSFYTEADEGNVKFDIFAKKSAATTYLVTDIIPDGVTPGLPTVASAAALELPTADSQTKIIHVKVFGTADITSIVPQAPGTVAYLLFTGTKGTTGVVDGNNLKLAGDLGYTPDDTLSLLCDGTNWTELSRSVN